MASRTRRAERAPRRSRYPFTIDDMQRLARERGGRVLSKQYGGDAEKLEWECAQQHVWRAPPDAIKAGRWCGACARAAQRAQPSTTGLAAPRREARRRGGAVLSATFLRAHDPLRWRCAEGHEWEASWSNVKRGTWCPHCAGTTPLTLERLSLVARSRGGACLGPYAEGNKTPIAWQCAERHVWLASPSSILRGTWCPSCRTPGPTTLAVLRRIARARGGRCLSSSCGGDREHVRWACAQGHEWSATPDSIKQGSWCPACYLPEAPSIQQLQRLAAERGGELLSRVYVDDRSPLRFRCAEGHVWLASSNQVKAGRWCATCAYAARKGVMRPRVDLGDLQALAEPHGGRCISPEYLGATQRHEWECAEGHVWSTTHGSIRKGSWCPECDRQRRRRRELYAVERGPLAAPPRPVVGGELRSARRRPAP